MFKAMFNIGRFVEQKFDSTRAWTILIYHLIFLAVAVVSSLVSTLVNGVPILSTVFGVVLGVVVFALFVTIGGVVVKVAVSKLNFKSSLKLSLAAFLPYTFFGNFISSILTIPLLLVLMAFPRVDFASNDFASMQAAADAASAALPLAIISVCVSCIALFGTLVGIVLTIVNFVIGISKMRSRVG